MNPTIHQIPRTINISKFSGNIKTPLCITYERPKSSAEVPAARPKYTLTCAQLKKRYSKVYLYNYIYINIILSYEFESYIEYIDDMLKRIYILKDMIIEWKNFE